MLTRRGFIAGSASLFGPWGCQCNETSKGGGKTVVSSIFPVHDLVRRIGGDIVASEILLAPGQSVHDFNPAPKVAKTVARSKALFSVGLQLDDWASKLAEAAGSGLPVVRLGDACASKTFVVSRVGAHSHIEDPHAQHAHDDHEDHGHEGHEHEEHEHEEHEEEQGHEGHHHPSGADPHVWLSVPNARKMAEAITRELSRVLPEHQGDFEGKAKVLDGELDALDAELRAAVKAFKKKSLVTFHGSFGYFAAEYGLNIAAVIEPFPGKQPSAAYLKEVLGALKGKPVAALFTEPQLDKRPAEVLAKEANLPVRELDPLGGVSGRDSYAALMRYNLAQLADVMG